MPLANESVHFHELDHVIQWQVLGTKNFLLLYASGLNANGSMSSPLEKIFMTTNAGSMLVISLPGRIRGAAANVGIAAR